MKKISIAILGLLLFSCASKNKTVTQVEEKVVVVTTFDEKAVAAGQVTYKANCAKCHKLYDPKDFNMEAWKPILDSMAKKAKLTDDQKNQVLAYLSYENQK